MKYADVIFSDDAGYYDLVIGSGGDFEKTQGFDTAILLSIYCERRASETEVPLTQRRRGWIGNQFSAVELGSKLWLLYQARLTVSTVNRARDYLEQGLKWLVDFGYLKSVVVTASRDLKLNGVRASIRLERFDDTVEHRNFVLWNETGRGFQ